MLTTGKKLDGRYVIREEIGGGGFGAVYLAEDTRFTGKNLVAIKRINQNNPQLAKSFRQEADLLYNLSHPNLPKVTNCFQEDGANFIVMDYVSGEDLGQSLSRGRRFSVPEVMNIADKVLDALEYLHSATIFHRDIKPHNIKIDQTGKIYLLDFGTAKGTFDETTLTQNVGQSITGYTPFYAPLEQVLRVDPNSYLLLQSAESPLLTPFVEKRTDERSDIYSLGATLYHLLSGISPETATSTFRAFSLWTGKPDPLRTLREINPDVPPALAEAVMRSLEIDPENRFQTAGEFRNALKNIKIAAPTVLAENISTAATLPIDTAEPLGKTQPSLDPTVLAAQNDAEPDSLESFLPLPPPAVKPSRSKIPLFAALAVLVLALVGFGGWLALREPAGNAPVVQPTADKNTKRTLAYSLLVQKMRDDKEFQEPFESSGQEIFETGYKFTMRFMLPDSGFVYIFAEGLDEKGAKIFNIAFPTPKQNEGKPDVEANQQYQTARNTFEGKAGTENFWIVWSKTQPEIAEKSRANAFQNAGKVSDKTLESELKNFLEKNKDVSASVSKDAEKKETKVQFSGDVTAYLIQLEHR